MGSAFRFRTVSTKHKTKMCAEKSVTAAATEMIQIEGVNMRVSAKSKKTMGAHEDGFD